MSHRLVGLCTALVVGGVLVAACGGGGSSTTTTTTSHSTASESSTATFSQTTSSTTSVTVPSSAAAAIVAECKKSISAQSSLSSTEKSELIDACQKAASGNITAARAAYEQVCETAIKDALPAGAAQTQALASCKDIGGTSPSGTVPASTGPTTVAGVSAAVLLEACKEYEGPAGVLLPSSVKGELASACAQAKAGNVSGAEAALKGVCEAYARLAPASSRPEIEAGCKQL